DQRREREQLSDPLDRLDGEARDLELGEFEPVFEPHVTLRWPTLAWRYGHPSGHPTRHRDALLPRVRAGRRRAAALRADQRRALQPHLSRGPGRAPRGAAAPAPRPRAAHGPRPAPPTPPPPPPPPPPHT